MPPAPASFGYLSLYLRRHGRAFLGALGFLAVEAACDLLQPTIMSRVIDRGIAAGDQGTVLRLGLLMLLVTLVGALAASGRNIISSRVSQRFGSELRIDLYRHIQGLGAPSLDRLETGGLVTRLTNDVTQVQNFANGIMRIFVKAPLLAVGGIIMATILDPRLAVVLLVAVPLVAGLIALSLRVSYPLYRRIQASLDRVNGVMGEFLSGVRVVKAFDGSRREEARFALANEALAADTARVMAIGALFNPATALVVNLGIGVVLWAGGHRVLGGSLRVGQVVAFVNYMSQILASLMMLAWVFTMFVRARASAERIGQVLSLEVGEDPGKAHGSAPTTHASPQGRRGALGRRSPLGLRFEGVGFTYDGAAAAALEDLTFDLGPGERLGVIGSTGSGKTTLTALLLRLYDPQSGRILADGTDLRDLDAAGLRARIALVPQRALLFTGTVADNLRWGRADAALADLEAACEAAAALDFVAALPRGFDTPLGRGGLSLSGGQRQRLCLARALLRRPDLLILDDATSAVDAVTEAAIEVGLRAACGEATVIKIAQRITSVMDSGAILVLDEGRMAGLGSHRGLLGTSAVYRDIAASQLGAEEALRG